ncbi:MAG: hypothetical protein M0Z67_10040 [Nitrospiraceae bacterium]|nr:hypothetical protein [Nitrospiraceae bacterium]
MGTKKFATMAGTVQPACSSERSAILMRSWAIGLIEPANYKIKSMS